jgi:hypothetical protein
MTESSIHPGAASPRDAPQMATRWQYLGFRCELDNGKLAYRGEDMMVKLGLEGWDLVTATPVRIYDKTPQAPRQRDPVSLGLLPEVPSDGIFMLFKRAIEDDQPPAPTPQELEAAGTGQYA